MNDIQEMEDRDRDRGKYDEGRMVLEQHRRLGENTEICRALKEAYAKKQDNCVVV